MKGARDTEAHLRRVLFTVRDIEPGFGWNPLTLSGERCRIDRRQVRPAQQVPAPRPAPKPVRAVLNSTPAMARRLAGHPFKPWWMR